jgi:hypothetical protein
MQTIHRTGYFFILVGLALLLMFVASVMSKEVHILYLFFSLATFFIAFLLLRNKKASESGRFRVIRQSREHRRQNPPGVNKPVKAGGIFGGSRQGSRHNRQRNEDKTAKSQRS